MAYIGKSTPISVEDTVSKSAGGTFGGDVDVTGSVTATSFSGDGSSLSGISKDLVADITPQLGGNLDTNSKNIAFGDSSGATVNRLTFGAGPDLEIYHDGNSKIADVGGGKLELHSDGTGVFIQKGATEYMAKFETDGAVTLYHDNSPKLATTATGVDITGVTTSTGFSGKIHPVNGTTTNYLSLKDTNELNFYNSSDASQTLHINYDGGNVDLAGSSVEITHGGGAIFKKVVQIQGDNLTTNLVLRGRSTDQNFYTLYKSHNGASTSASFGTDASNDTFNYQVDNHAFQNLASNTTYMKIKSDGNVGIGETSPENILHIKTSAAGGPQIELDSTSGTANSAFINFDGTSLQLATQRDMVDGSKRDTAKSWGGINIIGAAAGSYIQLQTSSGNNNAVSTKMEISKDGEISTPNQPIGYRRNVSASNTWITLSTNAHNIFNNWYTPAAWQQNSGANTIDDSGRFYAPVAGWYLVNPEIYSTTGSNSSPYGYANVYKNGSNQFGGHIINYGGDTNDKMNSHSVAVYMTNTDYVQIGVYVAGTGSFQVYSPYSGYWVYFLG